MFLALTLTLFPKGNISKSKSLSFRFNPIRCGGFRWSCFGAGGGGGGGKKTPPPSHTFAIPRKKLMGKVANFFLNFQKNIGKRGRGSENTPLGGGIFTTGQDCLGLF